MLLLLLLLLLLLAPLLLVAIRGLKHHGVDPASIVLIKILPLQTGADAVAEVLDDAHVLEPVVVRLGAVDVTLRLLGWRADTRGVLLAGLGGGRTVFLIGGAARALEDTAGETALVVGEVGAEAGGRGVGKAWPTGESRVGD